MEGEVHVEWKSREKMKGEERGGGEKGERRTKGKAQKRKD